MLVPKSKLDSIVQYDAYKVFFLCYFAIDPHLDDLLFYITILETEQYCHRPLSLFLSNLPFFRLYTALCKIYSNDL